MKARSATEVVSFPHRPIGLRMSQGKEPTFEDVRKWKEKSPNIILQQSYLTVGSAIAAVIGTVLGIIGFKKDSTLGKWFGGILALVGIGSGGVGAYITKLINEAFEEIKKSEEMYQRQFEILIRNSLQESISKKDETLRNEFRKQFINDRENIGKVKTVLEKIKSADKDEELREEASICLKMLAGREKEINEAIECLKDKSAGENERCDAAQSLRKISDKNVADALIERIKDKTDVFYYTDEKTNEREILGTIRSTAIMTIHKDWVKDIVLAVLKDDSDDAGIRSEAALRLVGLWKDGDESILEILKSIQISDKDEDGERILKRTINEIEIDLSKKSGKPQ